MTDKLGVMLCGHGSRDQGAVTEFANLAEKLKARLPQYPLEYGYLEFAHPVIREGLDKLRAAGCTRILAVPGMLFAAGHAKNDIPSVLNTYAAEHGIKIEYGKELGIDAKMLAAAGDRINEAIASAPGKIERHETLLVTVGRGASDPDANSNVSKVTRMLWEGLGLGWAETAYSGVTFPLVGAALENCAKLGFKRIIVFPYFLFTGILVDRIYRAMDEVAEKYPNIQFVKAGYLNDHNAVVETFAERVGQILTGDIAMNCSLCKYRTQVLGFEAEVGAAQESHHHHVEGIGVGTTPDDCAYCDDVCSGICRASAEVKKKALEVRGPAPHSHDHGHDHDHDHHHHDHDHPHDHAHDHPHDHAHDHGHTHAEYPHANHPLGPMSLIRPRKK